MPTRRCRTEGLRRPQRRAAYHVGHTCTPKWNADCQVKKRLWQLRTDHSGPCKDPNRLLKTAALDAGVPLRDVQEAASHADPRTTMRYDRARVPLDRHATYVVASFIAGAAR